MQYLAQCLLIASSLSCGKRPDTTWRSPNCMIAFVFFAMAFLPSLLFLHSWYCSWSALSITMSASWEVFSLMSACAASTQLHSRGSNIVTRAVKFSRKYSSIHKLVHMWLLSTQCPVKSLPSADHPLEPLWSPSPAWLWPVRKSRRLR